MPNVRTATTMVKPVAFTKEIKLEGRERFRVLSPSFVVSPLSKGADLHIVSIYRSVEDDKIVVTLNAGEYTQITGMLPDVLLYIDTDDTFYVKF